MQTALQDFKAAIASRDRAALAAALPAAMEENAPEALFSGALYPALDAAREEYRNRRLGIPELLLSLDMVGTVLRSVAGDPAIPRRSRRIVIGVIEGDIHDMGKNIIRDLYRGYGFDVTDLGKNVTVSQFVEAAVSEGADVVGISTMVSTTLAPLAEVIRRLKERKPDVKVIVGGAFINREIAETLKADAYAEDAATLIETTESLLS